MPAYHKLTTMEKQAYTEQVLQVCEAKQVTTRVNPKAVSVVITSAFSKMDHEVSDQSMASTHDLIGNPYSGATCTWE